MDLPDDVKIREKENMSSDELRIALLREGFNPYKDAQPRSWNEGQITNQSFC